MEFRIYAVLPSYPYTGINATRDQVSRAAVFYAGGVVKVNTVPYLQVCSIEAHSTLSTATPETNARSTARGAARGAARGMKSRRRRHQRHRQRHLFILPN